MNITVEKTIARANQLKTQQKIQEDKEVFVGEQNVERLIQIRDKEIENSQKLIKNNEKELKMMQKKLNDYKATD